METCSQESILVVCAQVSSIPSTQTWVTEDPASSSFMYYSLPQSYMRNFPHVGYWQKRLPLGLQFCLFLSVGYFSGGDPAYWQAVQKDSQAWLGVDFRACITFTFWRNSRSLAPLRVLEAPKSFKGRERPWLPSRLWYFIYVTEKTQKPKTWIAFIIWVTIARSGTFPTLIFFTGVSVSMQNHKRCAEGKQITEVPV